MASNSSMCFEEIVYQFGVAVAVGTACWIVQHQLIDKILPQMLTSPNMFHAYNGPASLVVGVLSLFVALFFLKRGALLGVSLASTFFMSLYVVPKIFEDPRISFFVSLALIILVVSWTWYYMRKGN